MGWQEELEHLTDLAQRMDLDDETSGKFINEAMEKLGYKATRVWTDPEPVQGGGQVSSFFGGSKSAPRQGQPTRGQKSGGSDWQYGS